MNDAIVSVLLVAVTVTMIVDSATARKYQQQGKML